ATGRASASAPVVPLWATTSMRAWHVRRFPRSRPEPSTSVMPSIGTPQPCNRWLITPRPATVVPSSAAAAPISFTSSSAVLLADVPAVVGDDGVAVGHPGGVRGIGEGVERSAQVGVDGLLPGAARLVGGLLRGRLEGVGGQDRVAAADEVQLLPSLHHAGREV